MFVANGLPIAMVVVVNGQNTTLYVATVREYRQSYRIVCTGAYDKKCTISLQIRGEEVVNIGGG